MEKFKEQYSKNFLKANYNKGERSPKLIKIQRTILKELFESKLQHSIPTPTPTKNSKNNTQRTFWKQTTTSNLFFLLSKLFKEQYSKNFLKANYNISLKALRNIIIQRTILKELFESKLQLANIQSSVPCIQRTILKELFESKLQL